MTRLEDFCRRLTTAMLAAYETDSAGTVYSTHEAARAVAERMVREFVAQGADQYMGASYMERYLDEPTEEPPR